MVCTVGSGRMAALAKLLSENPSRTASDDLGNQKSAMRLLCREISEANEVNLIDEEDMHVFDLEPMKDPLNLVICNACKKPIKVSCYAIHAELCRTLTSVQDNTLKLDGNNERKKPVRKERKKKAPVNTNQAKSVGVEQGRFHLVDSSAVSTSESQLVNATVAGVRGGPHALVASATSFVDHNRSQTAIPCPEKHSNTIRGKEPTPSLDHFEAANSATSHKSNPATNREHPRTLCSAANREHPRTLSSATNREHPRVPTIEKEKTVDQVVVNQIPMEVHEYPMPNKVTNVPAPFATKIYYSQRNNRERAAISRMYYDSIMNESTPPPDQSRNLTTMVPTSISNNYSLDAGFDHEQVKETDRRAHFARNPAQDVPQVSEMYFSRPGGLSSNTNISNKFPVNNILTPSSVPTEKTTSNYLSDPYSPDN